MRRSQTFLALWLPMSLAALTPIATVAAEAPRLRSRAEIEAVLAQAPQTLPSHMLRPLHIVLVADQKDHGPNEHDYPLWQKRWKVLLVGTRPAKSHQRRSVSMGRRPMTQRSLWPARQR